MVRLGRRPSWTDDMKDKKKMGCGAGQILAWWRRARWESS